MEVDYCGDGVEVFVFCAGDESISENCGDQNRNRAENPLEQQVE